MLHQKACQTSSFGQKSNNHAPRFKIASSTYGETFHQTAARTMENMKLTLKNFVISANQYFFVSLQS